MGYYDRLLGRMFFEEGGQYYVKPFGIVGRKRRFEAEQPYQDARAYMARAYRWLFPLNAICGAAFVMTSAWAIPIGIVVLNLWMVKRVTRGTVQSW